MMVWPSGFALTTRSVPSAPPAPGRLTGMIATLSSRESSSAMARAEVSVASPGASGMTSVTGPLGKSWAWIWVAAASNSAAHAFRAIFIFRILLSRHLVAQLPALGVRIAHSRGSFQSVPVCGDDLSFANVEDHRVEPPIDSAWSLVVDHHAHGPAVLALAQHRVLLVEGRGPGLELDQREIGFRETGSQVVADDLFVALGARAVVERRQLFARQGLGLAAGDPRQGGRGEDPHQDAHGPVDQGVTNGAPNSLHPVRGPYS